MQMTILDRSDQITHVVLTGRLDTTGTEEIGEDFSAATAARDRPAIVEISQVDFLASRGIGLLFANGKQLTKSGHTMVLVGPQPIVASVLQAAKVDKVLQIATELSDAYAILHLEMDAASAPPGDSLPDSAVADRSPPPLAVNDGELKVQVKNELHELPGLNAQLASFLETHGVPPRASYAVNLAIDEMVVNVMRYAYVDDDTHLIDIDLSVKGDQVILRIEDDGRPFDPRRSPSLDLHAEDREAGGLGLILVLELVDMLHYERVDEKNCVEVRVHLVAEGGQDDLAEGE